MMRTVGSLVVYGLVVLLILGAAEQACRVEGIC